MFHLIYMSIWRLYFLKTELLIFILKQYCEISDWHTKVKKYENERQSLRF